ncbi:MAG: ATP-dependent DNA helicase RecG [Candidatus Pacebacteria bacterium]|nr:ATP-dependent DNA helicase RecG [Candidatus Paceibacterota bacterium]
MLKLEDKITQVSGIGPALEKKLKRLKIETAKDLLLYFPWYYEDIGQAQPIANLQIGQKAGIVGKIDLISSRRSFKRKLYITEALISDESGTIKAVWFNRKFLKNSLQAGDILSLAGKIEEKNGQLTISSPVYEKINQKKGQIHTAGIVPYYHLTAGLTHKQLRFLIKKIISLANVLDDWLPEDTKKRLNILDKSKAIEKIHFPKNFQELKEAKKRLAFEELFLRQLKSEKVFEKLSLLKANPIAFKEKATKEFVKQLPFTLTAEQKQATWEIIQDIKADKPMIRLLQGDVGSGKTVVAAIALLNLALNNQKSTKSPYQAIFMAPTEILAKQHFHTLQKLFKNWSIKIQLHTRSYKEKNYQSKNELADIIIGTQALLQDKSPVENPSLLIVDEQHRFGVNQRYEIIKKYQETTPHFLSMTATPIPRTLALSIYGHIGLSTIKNLPPGRQEVITKIVEDRDKEKMYQFITKKLEAGDQAFVICPLISPTDKLGARSVEEEIKSLKKIFPQFAIDKLHGKMRSQDKDKAMKKFLDNETKILVSTSVVEVGVDVPNATIMIIEGSERFGLAQLHQFRGRIGRGKKQSYCFLKASAEVKSKALERLEATKKYSKGSELAKEDLKLRGSGEIYGTMQSGFPELKFASLFDLELIKASQIEAKRLIKKDPRLLKSLKYFSDPLID